MKSAFKITIIYIIFASLWIIISDKVVEIFSLNVTLAAFYSSIKGLAFVVITGLLLFLLVTSDSKKQQVFINRLTSENDQKKQLIKELHHRISSNIKIIKSLFLHDKEHAFIEEKMRILSKLNSMESVFNILYNNPNFDRLTEKNVFDEYMCISGRNITIRHTYLFNTLNVETLVSLLLIIDTIIDCLFIDNGVKKVDIEIRSEDNITLTFESINKQLPELLGHCDSIIEHYLKQVSGTLELQNDYVSHIIILFSDQNCA